MYRSGLEVKVIVSPLTDSKALLSIPDILLFCKFKLKTNSLFIEKLKTFLK